jgi:hypothetical protein
MENEARAFEVGAIDVLVAWSSRNVEDGWWKGLKE